MKPLNYAILKYLTTVDEACVEDVMNALRSEYGHFKAFKKDEIVTAMMTAETNGLLEEARFDLDDQGDVRVYFRAPEDGKATINRYIVD